MGRRQKASSPESRRQAVTIRDIADRAGVSTATVSRALSHPAKVSPEVRARVLREVETTGYRPNTLARNLRVQRSMMVLVIVPNLANSFYPRIIGAMDDEFIAAGYDMILGSLDNKPDREARYVRLAAARQVDGVVLLSGRVPVANDESMAAYGLPMVGLAAPLDEFDGPQVLLDDVEAGRQVAAYLLALGHRRFGYVPGLDFNVNQQDRLEGFRQGLRDAGIASQALKVWPCGPFTMARGFEVGEQYLAQAKATRPTAIFASSDTLAIGVMKVLLAAGVRIPQDVSVVGFDGIDFADFVEPTLTTVRQPRELMGKMAAAALLRELGQVGAGGGDVRRSSAVERVEGSLVIGGSCGPAT